MSGFCFFHFAVTSAASLPASVPVMLPPRIFCEATNIASVQNSDGIRSAMYTLFGPAIHLPWTSLISGTSITLASNRVSAGTCFEIVHIACRLSGECMKSMYAAALAGSLALVGMPNPWVSRIGVPAIVPVPNVGITMNPTVSAPSFDCEFGRAGVVLKHIADLPLSNISMPWYSSSEVASSLM